MKSFFSGLEISALRLVLTGFFCLLFSTAHASIFGEMLAEDWGWIPERAGLVAAESQGMVPKVEGKNAADFYQRQQSNKYFSALAPLQNELLDVSEIALTPPGELPPNDALPMPQGFCEVAGEVSDDRLEPLPGVVIEVKGTVKTSETDKSGKFNLGTLPSGNVIIEASKLGYVTNAQSATALPGQKLNIRISLKLKPSDGNADETTLEEETVVGEFQEKSNAGDFNLAINLDAPKLSATMGREEFAKTGVSDAGEAIAKISGANIVDGKYAVVRGLADRYVTSTFNGGQIASADPSRKAVQLDLFPTSSIESIKVEKTYTPNMAGDFGGGAIDIITRSLPPERILSFSTKVTYNDSLEDTIYTRQQLSLGTLGNIGDPMPSILETTNPDGTVKFIDRTNTGSEELTERWKILHDSQNMRPKEVDSQLGYSQAFTYGETFELPNKMKLGLMTAFSRSSGDSSNSTTITNQTREFIRDEFSRSLEWAAYLSTALEINEWNRIQATYFKKHIASEDISNSTNIIDDEENLNYGFHLQNTALNPANDYGPDAIYYGAAWDITPLTRDLEIYQFNGHHQFGERGVKLDWGITRSFAREERPHSSHFEYGVLDFSSEALAGAIAAAKANLNSLAVTFAGQVLGLPNPETYTWETIKESMYANPNTKFLYDYYTAQNAVLPDDTRDPVETSAHGGYAGSVPGKQRLTRRSEKTTEDAIHQQASGAVPYYFSETDDDRYFEFGFGASHLSKQRTTVARQYDLVMNLTSENDPGFPPGALDGPGGLGEMIAADPTIISNYFTGNTNGGPYYINSLTKNGLENITTTLNQTAYYYSGLFRLGSTFLTGGIRFEQEAYDIDIEGVPLSAFTDEQIDANGWNQRDPLSSVLPAVSTGTAIFDDKLSFQVAWSQTVARPTFWEFIPSRSFDQASGLGRQGNNTLGQTEIDNFDLAITWQASENSSIRASLFHKNLLRPLVTFYESGVLLFADSFKDPDSGLQEDFEATINGIELEADITNVGPFSLRSNFTYIDAQLNYFYASGGVVTGVTSKLPYQPTYLANINLGYEYEPWSLNTNLIYNYNGDYPTILKLTPDDSEVVRNSIDTVDLVLSKKIQTEGVEYNVKAGLKNIFNAVDTYIFMDKTFNSNTAGRSYWMEVQLSF
jgi:TonB-dependent receptor